MSATQHQGERDGPPTICFCTFTYPPMVGGVARSAARIVSYLVQTGYRVHVITTEESPSGGADRVEARRSEENGAIVHRVTARAPASSLQAAFEDRIRHIDEVERFDLFHGFFLPAAYPCLSLANEGPRARPVVASIRGSDAIVLFQDPRIRPLIMRVLRRAAWVTSVNRDYLDRVGAAVDLSGRCSVIANGIELSADAPPWALSDRNEGVVGTIGEFRSVKDVPLLVRAYARVRPALRRGLLLAGFFSDADEEEWSNVLIDELGIRPETRLTGRFPPHEAAAMMRAMHVYVQPSAFEGMPNALLEAAAAGVPLVATAVGGMKEFLTDGQNALLVPHGDPAALGAAIERLLSDRDTLMRLSAGARALAASLSAERERAAWLNLYATLLTRSPPFEGISA